MTDTLGTAKVHLAAVDPGLHRCGLAVFSQSGELLGAWVVRPDRAMLELPAGPDRQSRLANNVAGKVIAALRPHAPLPLLGVETPQVYQGGRQKGDPNDLIALATEVGAIVQGVGARESRVVQPAQWKRQVQKDAMGRRIWGGLTPSERTLMPTKARSADPQPDTLDAVGLGLWLSGRLR